MPPKKNKVRGLGGEDPQAPQVRMFSAPRRVGQTGGGPASGPEGRRCRGGTRRPEAC